VGSTITLAFTVKETNPEPHGDPPGVLPGDVNLAGLTVTLVAVGNGANNESVVCTSSYVPADPLAYTDAKTFSCTFTGVAVDAYEVQADVTGVGAPVAVYYTGLYRDVLTVYDTDAGFVTGGGKFIYPGSEDRVNFGLVYSFTGKGKTTPRGNLLVMRHLENGDVCRAKSNGIGAPGVVGADASFSGKGNYVCTTPEGSSYDGAGNISILGWVRDNGEPGASSAETPDLFWIRALAPGSELLMTMGVPLNAEPLVGGNIQVPHKTASGGKK
jgi:hypothetical protein